MSQPLNLSLNWTYKPIIKVTGLGRIVKIHKTTYMLALVYKKFQLSVEMHNMMKVYLISVSVSLCRPILTCGINCCGSFQLRFFVYGKLQNKANILNFPYNTLDTNVSHSSTVVSVFIGSTQASKKCRGFPFRIILVFETCSCQMFAKLSAPYRAAPLINRTLTIN